MHIVDQVFEDHWPYLYQFQRLGWKTQAVFYMALLFINLYPHAVQTDRVLSCGLYMRLWDRVGIYIASAFSHIRAHTMRIPIGIAINYR